MDKYRKVLGLLSIGMVMAVVVFASANVRLARKLEVLYTAIEEGGN